MTIGRNTRVYVYRDGSPVASGCAISLTKNTSSEDIETTTADSGQWAERIGGKKDHGGTINSMTTLDMVGTFQYPDWIGAVGTVVRLLVVYRNGHDDTYTYDANVLITDVSEQSNVSDFARFDVTWLGSGAPTITLQLEDALLDSEGDYIWDSNGELIRTP